MCFVASVYISSLQVSKVALSIFLSVCVCFRVAQGRQNRRYLFAGDAPANMLLDGDRSAGAPGVEGCPGSLPPAQLGRLAEAAAGEVAPHGRLDLDSRAVSLRSTHWLMLACFRDNSL